MREVREVFCRSMPLSISDRCSSVLLGAFAVSFPVSFSVVKLTRLKTPGPIKGCGLMRSSATSLRWEVVDWARTLDEAILRLVKLLEWYPG